MLHAPDPASVLGDGASAVVLRRGVRGRLILDTELWSDGALHDVYYIPGGALAHPDRPELYRLVLDKRRYDAAPKMEVLKRLAARLCERAPVRLEDVKLFLYPNISTADRAAFGEAFGLRPEAMTGSSPLANGHLQGNDFVANYLAAESHGRLHEGDYVLMASHGMGYLEGVSLMRC